MLRANIEEWLKEAKAFGGHYKWLSASVYNSVAPSTGKQKALDANPDWI